MQKVKTESIGDDDRIADPDFVPDLEVMPIYTDDFEEVDGVNIDTIIENIEYSSSTSQPPTPSETFPHPGPSSRPGSSGRSQAKQKLNLQKYLSVDEQICSTKARHNLKRYNGKKPHKWGYKIYVLIGVSGFAYKFEPETGAENVVGPNEPNLGAAANVVVRLAREIPRNQNYRLYFDNYFTSLLLLEYFTKQRILSLGTIRRNRIPDCKLPAEKEISKTERSYSVEYVACVQGTDISTVAWKDNKIVTLASSFVGELPKSQVSRYNKPHKR
ncbi:unnamed protein product [Parnassius apollo]|uniref:(apollo) hypothetical protein n=1 Tax=Parnassius apollo TaxID=110799 RepID=A0A8S3WA69_PARAO|nr:unnamed protein product [Parnassius apollo]